MKIPNKNQQREKNIHMNIHIRYEQQTKIMRHYYEQEITRRTVVLFI